MKKIFRTISIVIIFSASICSKVCAQVLNITQTSQEHNQWCWDASSKCVLDYYNNVVSQCTIANWTWSRSDCCGNSNFNWTHQCNNPNSLWGSSGSIKDIIYHFGNIQSNGTQSYLSLSEIQTEITNQRPFFVRWQWTGPTNTGHILVGHGISGSDIYLMDPWYGEESGIQDYEWVKNGSGSEGTHTWSHTLALNNTNPPYCTDNFESNNNGSSATQVFAVPLTGPANYPMPGTNIGYSGDQDWYRIDLNTAGNLQINLSNLPYNYDLYLYSDAAASNLLRSSTNTLITNESLTYNNSSSNLVHLYAKVIAANGTDHWTGSCYNLQFIYTPSAICALTGITPTLVSPGTSTSPGQPINSLTPTLTWNNVSGATNYGVYVMDIALNTLVVSEDCATTNASYTVPSGILIEGKQYKWYINANITCGNCASNIANPFYFHPQTSGGGNCSLTGITPTILSPGTNAFPGQTIATTTPTLTWDAVSGAANYGVYVRDLVSNLLVVDINCATSGTNYPIPSGILSNGGQYRWNIIATDVCGSSCVSHYASVRYFNIQTTSCVLTGVIPTLLSPGMNSSPGQTISNTTPTLSWNPVQGASNYDVYVWDMVSNSLVVNQPCATTVTSYMIPTGILNSGVQYKWYIQANLSCGSCISNNSSPLYFQINTNCTYNLPISSASFTANGGTSSFVVNTTAGCNWTAIASAPSWISFINSSGTGTGNVIYTVAPNPGTSRTGYIYLPGNTFTINQSGTSTPSGLFWVGGSGNWSDGNHWSNTSGGAPCNCIPTITDNVYFDANSFGGGGQSVNVNQLAYCKSMDWTGAVSSSTLTGANPLNIYGSFILNSLMNITYSGQITFKSSNPGNNIQTLGKTLSSEIYFDALGGEWTLQDNFTLPNNSIFLLTGSFNTNGKTINAYHFENTGNGICLLTLGSSIINLSSGCTGYYCNYAWYIVGSNLTLSAGTSTINLTGSTGYFYSPYTNTYYDVNFTGSSSGNLQCGSNSVFHNVSFSGTGSLNGTATYNNVSFLKDGSLNSTSTFNNLTLSAGKTYTLVSNNNFTINGTLSADGTCATPTQIFSNSQGTAATISKSSGAINVNYVRLRDITATGGAVFTANNCTNFGNNNGWSINTPSSQNLYWVGNGGNWTDGNHWSFTSGGSSSGCIPTPYNNVFFDLNSFSGGGQSVIVDQMAYCRSMDWTGAVSSSTLTGANPLNIYGSFILNSLMNITYSGQITFKSSNPGNNIQTLGKTLSSEIYFDALGGEWTLQDNFTLPNNSIFLLTGSFNTNGKTINAYHFENTGNGICLLTLGSSIINLSSGCTGYYCNYAWYIVGSNLTLSAGTSTINLTGSTGYFYSPYTNTYYDVNFTGSSSGNLQCGSNSVFHNVSFSGTGSLNGTATYNNVSFLKDGSLNSTSTFNNLTLSAGKTYTLVSNNNFTINGTLSADGTCATPTQIFSNSQGTAATISKSSGAINVNYVRLRDITATGGAVFTANNTTDLGNNNGWFFTPFTSQNYYWVGNGGNWSDGNHWSLTSGGSSSGCIPTLYDNVFFDVNSFASGGQTVTINQLAYCKSMDWTGAVSSSTLTGANPLNIYGSFILNSLMNITYSGQITFKSSNPGNNIQTLGKTLSSEIYFDALGGEWTLQDNFTLPNNSIFLLTGSFNTNGKTINAYHFENTGNGICLLTLGSSIINLSSGCTGYYCNYAWYIVGSNLTLSAGTSTINLTGSTGYFYSPYTNTYYDVNFTGSSSGNLQCGSNSVFHNVSFSGTGSLNGTATYNNVSFLKDGSLNSTSTFNNLTLSAGKTYTLVSNNNFTINGTLSADGTCATPTQIFSNSQGTAATISKSSGAINVNYVRLRDITATGGAVFTANNCTNFGNNNGWSINTPSSQNLYWVGNGGNWTDGNHWSFTSGGSSSGCIPTPYNNVFFDLNSFSGGGQSVIVDQMAYCRSMDWTGAVSSSTLTGANPLNIYGSFILNSLMNITYSGQITFKSSNPGNNIQTLGKTLSSEIYFDALGGEWTLQDNFTLPNNSIFLLTGSFNTNGKTINAYHFENTGNGICLLTLGSSIINLSSGCTGYYCNYAWYIVGSNLTLSAGTSTINLTGSTGYFYSPYTNTYYDVNFTGSSSGNLQCGSNSVFHNVSFSGTGSLNGTATYNNVSFLKDGSLNSTSTFNNLTLSAGKTFNFASGTIHTFNGSLYATGTSGNLITISCSSGYVIFSKISGSFCLDYVTMQNIHVTGSGYFFAGSNSNNVGGNIGWSFTSCSVGTPPTPGNPSSNSPQCNIVTLTASGSPPSGLVWYWQGISCGTSTTLGSGNTYSATSSGTYYLRAYDPACSCWSPGCGSVSVIVNQSTGRTWTGIVSTDWTNAGNWTCGSAPNPDSDVIIPSGTPFSPILPAGMAVWCRSLWIMPGAIVEVGTNAHLNILH